MPSEPTAAGRSLVTRRAVVDIARNATLDSYGVTGLASTRVQALVGHLGFAQPGIKVRLAGDLSIALDVNVAYGVPIAEVSRQVDSAVRYAIRRALGREVDHLSIHVDGLDYTPVAAPPAPIHREVKPPRPRDLADTGADVA